MKKLTLDLDALRVESFETSPAERVQRGTVVGYIADPGSGIEPLQNIALAGIWDTIIGACPSWFICTQATACEC